MSGIDVSEYALFNTGSDTPWPDDYIEFINTDNVVIHRGNAVGFYRYKYDGIIVDRDVDAEDLIDMGLAQKISLDICKPWEDSYIEFVGDKLVLRNFLAPSRGKKNYIVFEDGKFYVVNKYYLLANSMASVTDEKIYADVELPKIDYNSKTTPWKEDGIRFITDRIIEKSTKPGMYVEKHGSITSMRSLTAILGMGYAILERDAKKHFFPQFCQSEKTKREYKGETLTGDFKDAYFTDESPIIAKDNFSINSLYELMICYHCVKQSVVPFGKEDEMYIESVDPSVVEEYRVAIESYRRFISKIEELKQKHHVLKQRATTYINENLTKASIYFGSAEYVYWRDTLSSKKQPNYEIFYKRAVESDFVWDNLKKKTSAVVGEYFSRDADFESIKNEINGVELTLKNLKSSLKTPSQKGTRKDEAKLAEVKALADEKPFINECKETVRYITTEVSKTKTILFTETNLVEEDKKLIDKRIQKFNEIKNFISANEGKTAKGKLASLFNKALKPWTSDIEYIRKDFLIERIESISCSFDGVQRTATNCYRVTLEQNRTEILFPSALIYVGLAKRK